jgi:hypothetical protein
VPVRIHEPDTLTAAAETESGRNSELIWLLRTLCPDYRTIAEFRRKNGEALKNDFKGFVRLCAKPGMYGKELPAIDGSKFKAANSKERNYTEGKLQKRIERLEKKTEEYLKELEETGREEAAAEQEKSAEETRNTVKGLKATLINLTLISVALGASSFHYANTALKQH